MLVGAVFDACRAVSAVKKRNAELASDKSRCKRQDEDFAHVRFRSRKNPKQTFTVQANCVSGKGIYRSKLGDMRMTGKLPVPENRNLCRTLLENIPALGAWLSGCAVSANDSCLSGNVRASNCLQKSTLS